MNIPFYKMHGAANDFIMADDRLLTFPAHDKEWIARIAARRTGVGCEGVILIQPSKTSSFRMRFFNPDGSEVEMCGNGARCVARLAHEIGAAPAQMTIETIAGELKAEARDQEVLLYMTEPTDWRLNRSLDIDGKKLSYHFVNSGVPHVVVVTNDLEAIDVHKVGAAIRYHSDFAPKGTNANFIVQTGPGTLRIRTYERGVEGETLACGTGMVAACLVAGKLGLVKPPVKIVPASGDLLTVNYELTETGATQVTLLGPAVQVFQGTLSYPG
ncbi:MAG TPA: diaminopimelate epimerase [Verrucomicrobia bacterium]|nr:MAG: diaminopimelate epimerase [Lentisphaerae bacterium GWF2_57_35]HBA84724.1 diaminopimelate epimerase [Verrucomicrobiota bacterium]